MGISTDTEELFRQPGRRLGNAVTVVHAMPQMLSREVYMLSFMTLKLLFKPTALEIAAPFLGTTHAIIHQHCNPMFC